MKRRILIVDDERAFRELIRCRFPPSDYAVFEAATGTDALSRIDRDGPFDAISLDIMMSPGAQLRCVKGFECGMAVLRALLQTHPGMVRNIVVVTVRDDEEIGVALKQMGIQNFCSKSTDDVQQLAAKLKMLADRR